MITVACVKWGDRYSDKWVTRLRAMVRKHLAAEHRFVCFTDLPVEGVNCEPLTSGLPGWWAKLELLKPGKFTGWVAYFDLDLVIRGPLDPLVDAAMADPSKVWMRDDFSYSLRAPRKTLDTAQKQLLGGDGCCNSSVMIWNGDAGRLAWDRFTPEVMEKQHGDQNHISRVLWPHGIGFLPDNLISSYKYGGDGPVTVFHGQPKMDELPDRHPMRVQWERADHPL